jgi:hypothetical protein
MLQNQPEKTPSTDGEPSSMGSEARIQHLEAEVATLTARVAAFDDEAERARSAETKAGELADEQRRRAEAAEAALAEAKGEIVLLNERAEIAEDAALKAESLEAELAKTRARADDEYRRAEEAMLGVVDLRIVAKAARHGGPPEGFEPKTQNGKEALAEVVLLGSIAKGQREQAQDAARLPEVGWSSTIARQLVETLPAKDRALLLGDLLSQLHPHTGEQGQNETATDVLRRIVAEVDMLRGALAKAKEAMDVDAMRMSSMSERMVKIQSAMVARRAPDAEAGAVIETLGRLLAGASTTMGRIGILTPSGLAEIAEAVLAEWRGLRAFLSEAPLVAVAVRDDGAKGPVRERFSLLVLKWDGKAVSTKVIEGTRPWGDIAPYIQETVLKHLVPPQFR